MKTEAPESRLGLYKRYTDIPQQHRLSTFEGIYDGVDVWEAYLTANDKSLNQAGRAGKNRWLTATSNAGEHYALASPQTVEAYAKDAAHLSDWSRMRYLAEVYKLYRWLLWHTDHPHRYNPVLIAAAEHETTRETWTFYVGAN